MSPNCHELLVRISQNFPHSQTRQKIWKRAAASTAQGFVLHQESRNSYQTTCCLHTSSAQFSFFSGFVFFFKLVLVFFFFSSIKQQGFACVAIIFVCSVVTVWVWFSPLPGVCFSPYSCRHKPLKVDQFLPVKCGSRSGKGRNLFSLLGY